jgi:predicted dienelactone hydrolase
MRHILTVALLWTVLGWCCAARAQDLYKCTPGPYPVKIRDLDWRDEARMRDVPVRLYIPAPRAAAGPFSKDLCDPRTGKPQIAEPTPPGPFPVIVFSHGMGASRQTYGYICTHLASHGYLVIAPTHKGSDTTAVRDGLRQRLRDGGRGRSLVVENTSDPENLKNRPRDVSFVLDRIATDEQFGKLADLSRVGAAGHSFGAYTVLAAAGMSVDLPGQKSASFRDRRIKAAVPMSPQGAGATGIRPGAWDGVTIPVLFLTGTRDYGQGKRPADWRRQPFEAVGALHQADDYLMTLNGATHFTFAHGPGSGRSERSHQVELIQAGTTAFFDAYVKGDAEARKWLATFAAAKHDDCTVEFSAAR